MNQKNLHQTTTPEDLIMKDPELLGRLFPSFSYGDPSEVSLPSFDELVVLGQRNLRYIRTDMRAKERKIRAISIEAAAACALRTVTIDDLQHYVSLSAINSGHYSEAELLKFHQEGHIFMCDWQGSALDELRMSDLPAEEWRKRGKELAHTAHTCRYGRFVAEWCQQAPFPQQCKGRAFCIDPGHTATIMPMLPTKVNAGYINPDDPEHKMIVLPADATPPANCKRIATLIPSDDSPTLEQRTCPHYQECVRATHPFEDRPCILANGTEETLADCYAYLERNAELWDKRLKKLQSYIGALTAAIKQADPNLPLLDIWAYDEIADCD